MVDIYPILAGYESPFDEIGELKDCLSCVVTDKINEFPELTLTYPAGGTLENKLVTDRTIKVKTNAGSADDLFRIISVSRNHNNIVTVKAIHVAFELSFIPTTMCYQSESSPDTIFGMLMSEINNRASNSFYVRSSLDKPALIDGFDYIGCTAINVIRDVQNRCGGELTFWQFSVELCSHRGSDNGYEIAYGENMMSFQMDYTNEGLYTHILPYAKYRDANGNIRVLTLENDIELIISLNPLIQREGSCAYKKILPVDLSGSFNDGEEFRPDVLYIKAQAYMQEEKNITSTADVLNVQTSYVHLGDTVQYKSEITQNINGVGDIITVKYYPWGINRKCEVVMTAFDALTEMYNSIQLSTVKPNLANVMRTVGDSLNERQPQNRVWKNYQISKDKGLEFVYQEGEENGGS